MTAKEWNDYLETMIKKNEAYGWELAKQEIRMLPEYHRPTRFEKFIAWLLRVMA